MRSLDQRVTLLSVVGVVRHPLGKLSPTGHGNKEWAERLAGHVVALQWVGITGKHHPPTCHRLLYGHAPVDERETCIDRTVLGIGNTTVKRHGEIGTSNPLS